MNTYNSSVKEVSIAMSKMNFQVLFKSKTFAYISGKGSETHDVLFDIFKTKSFSRFLSLFHRENMTSNSIVFNYLSMVERWKWWTVKHHIERKQCEI